MLLMARTTAGTVGRGARRALSRTHRHAARAARRGIELPELPRRRRVPGEVWAVAMVRDELDVLPAVLDHLERQGVDRVLVSDNGSTDGTLEELRARAADGRLLLALDREPAYHQAAKMSLLAHAAGRAGADWVVPFDADELWFADSGLLADRLRSLDADVAGARMTNVFPRRGGGWVADREPHWHGKVAFRAHRLAQLHQGNHGVDRPGARSAAPPLRVAHLPWRSPEQVARKVRQGADAYSGVRPVGTLGGHWRSLARASDDELVAEWEALLDGHGSEGMHWYPRGDLVDADPTTWTTWDPDGVLERVEAPGEAP
ncbi:glycosyltransferase family 2 protein [Phycicoccus sp. CSK15P-2]|uniref:glycosyltransferase family 2 protein n=1 Tax=Phycicoccus sp. CSK15P-2 TaxID=2807627 RepID=UPI001EF2EE09|nr:glycosyltransferase family 2 protein [Phycicoccus sp. CSK15P-2]